jgi:hypothetical protein
MVGSDGIEPPTPELRTFQGGHGEIAKDEVEAGPPAACGPSSPTALDFGKLYRRTGERGQASEHLTNATIMYREMGMTCWLEQAAAETAGLR